MKKPYHPKRTSLARHYVKDHKRRLARFNYSIKKEAIHDNLPEMIIVVARQFGYAIAKLDDYL